MFPSLSFRQPIKSCKFKDTLSDLFFQQDIRFDSNCCSFSTNDYISGKVPTDPLGLTDGKCIFCGSCCGAGKKSTPVESFQKCETNFFHLSSICSIWLNRGPVLINKLSLLNDSFHNLVRRTKTDRTVER